MFRTLKAAWRAGRSRQPMPTVVDRSTGNTVAIAGVFGIAVIAIFGTAYAIGTVEKRRREEEARIERGDDDEDLRKLEEDARAAKLELDADEIHVEDDEEEPYIAPPGSAACPICQSVFLDADQAADCCADARGWDQDTETGEITDPSDDGDGEPDGAEDLWADHVSKQPT